VLRDGGGLLPKTSGFTRFDSVRNSSRKETSGWSAHWGSRNSRSSSVKFSGVFSSAEQSAGRSADLICVVGIKVWRRLGCLISGPAAPYRICMYESTYQDRHNSVNQQRGGLDPDSRVRQARLSTERRQACTQTTRSGTREQADYSNTPITVDAFVLSCNPAILTPRRQLHQILVRANDGAAPHRARACTASVAMISSAS